MKSKYYLHFDDGETEIPKENFETINSHYQKLTQIRALEQIFDSLIDEYMDLKKFLYCTTIDATYSLLYKPSEIDRYKIRTRISRHFFNILNLGKKLLDFHVYANKKRSFVLDISGDSELHKQILIQRQEVYDESIAYRLLCEIRNIEQHIQDSAIDVTSVGFNKLHHISKGNHAVQRFFTISITKNKILELLAQRHVKEKDLTNCLKNIQFDNLPDKVDMHKYIDEFITSIYKMYIRNIELTQSEKNTALAFFEKLKFNGNTKPYKITKMDSGKVIIEINPDLSWFTKIHNHINDKYSNGLLVSAFYIHPYLDDITR